MKGVHDDDQQLAHISDLMSLYSASIEFYHRQQDEENYAYYIDKLSKLNKQIGGIIDRENRQLTRAKDKKKKKKEANGIKDKTNTLTINPLTGKEIVKSQVTEPNSAQIRRANTMLAHKPPELTPMERKRMKNNMQMALA